MKAIMVLTLLAVISYAGIPDLSLASAPADHLPWGKSSDGIQLSLTSTDPDGRSLLLAFQNVGDRDVTLNLGFMMANGKVQLPNHVHLKFTDALWQRKTF
jgi:hypothetical protein